MTQQKIRKLINNERKFLLAPANVTVLARVKGNINYYALEKAINQVKHKHPLITSRIETNQETKYFVKDTTLQIPLRSVPRTSETQWIDEIRQENLTPFDHSNEPLIRFILVYSPEVSEIMAYSQHAICDGTALAFLLRDILQAMNEPDGVLEELNPVFELTEILGGGQGGFGQRVKSLFVNRINTQWKKRKVVFDHEDYLSIHKTYNEKFEYGIVLIEFDEKQTKELNARCRSHEVTINSALTCALVKAYQDVFNHNKGKKVDVVMPFDLRRRTDPPLDDVFCLLVGSVEVSLKLLPNLGFWDDVKRAHKEIKSKIEKRDVFESALMIEELDPTLADAIISFAPLAKEVSPESSRYEKLSSFASDKKNPAIDIASKFSESLPDVINTNLGRLGFPEKYGKYELDTMYFAPAGSFNVPLLAGFLGVSGKITGTLTYLRRKEAQEDLQGEKMRTVRNKVLEYLEVS